MRALLFSSCYSTLVFNTSMKGTLNMFFGARREPRLASFTPESSPYLLSLGHLISQMLQKVDEMRLRRAFDCSPLFLILNHLQDILTGQPERQQTTHQLFHIGKCLNTGYDARPPGVDSL